MSIIFVVTLTRDCGCGSGDSGCTSCGCCKVCAGETDSWSGGISFQELEEVEPEMFERIRRARSRKEKKGKEKKEDKGGMGLQLLFGGQSCDCHTTIRSYDSVYNS